MKITFRGYKCVIEATDAEYEEFMKKPERLVFLKGIFTSVVDRANKPLPREAASEQLLGEYEMTPPTPEPEAEASAAAAKPSSATVQSTVSILQALPKIPETKPVESGARAAAMASTAQSSQSTTSNPLLLTTGRRVKTTPQYDFSAYDFMCDEDIEDDDEEEHVEEESASVEESPRISAGKETPGRKRKTLSGIPTGASATAPAAAASAAAASVDTSEKIKEEETVVKKQKTAAPVNPETAHKIFMTKEVNKKNIAFYKINDKLFVKLSNLYFDSDDEHPSSNSNLKKAVQNVNYPYILTTGIMDLTRGGKQVPRETIIIREEFFTEAKKIHDDKNYSSKYKLHLGPTTVNWSMINPIYDIITAYKTK
jgi:hypothetical protein